MAPRGRRPRIVTLSTDIGAAYAAQMKAVLARSIDPGRIVDLAHDLPAHGVAEAAFLLRAMARGFPAGTIHVAVVDPGVGGRRAPLAIACRDGSLLVGPDNGLLWPLAAELGAARTFAIDPAMMGVAGRVGRTFDGRDLFAPAAARLARGTPVTALGRPHRPRRLVLPPPVRRSDRLVGTIVHIDRFGNLITSLPSEWLPRGGDRLRWEIGHRRGVAEVVTHYAEIRDGRYGVLGSSFGTLEIARREESAADRLHTVVGAPVLLRRPVGRTRN